MTVAEIRARNLSIPAPSQITRPALAGEKETMVLNMGPHHPSTTACCDWSLNWMAKRLSMLRQTSGSCTPASRKRWRARRTRKRWC